VHSDNGRVPGSDGVRGGLGPGSSKCRDARVGLVVSPQTYQALLNDGAEATLPEMTAWARAQPPLGPIVVTVDYSKSDRHWWQVFDEKGTTLLESDNA
jgi:hypothetical protein